MAQTCYRHPGRETGVSCSSCGRPICPECMTPTPVGMRCPECASQRTRVTRGVPSGSGALGSYPATVVLIAINVIVFIAEIARSSGGLNPEHSPLLAEFGLFGPSVADGEWYRLFTSAFLHQNLIHIGGNMLLLYFLGRILEPGIGTARFTAVYLASLFAGSLGALLVTPDALSFGASGAVFGIIGATFVIARHRRIDSLASSVGVLILLNLAISIGVPGISLGAHVGGLVAGALCALLIAAGERGRLGENRFVTEMAAIGALGLIAIVASIAIA
jgi:membrane associated rhomboid family serine protease